MRRRLASIIICTCDRAEDLHETLTAISRVRVPDALTAEIILVDNGSTDHTPQIAQAFQAPHLPLRYLSLSLRGLSGARNAGLAQAQGEIFLFTDDDVRPPQDWMAAICAPLMSGNADAVAGGVKIAGHLERPWMTPAHRAWLASTETILPDSPAGLVGASMALTRQAVTKVPAFDPELGAGALGFGEETLLSLQLREAGCRIATAFETSVEHHFHPSRLSRASFLKRALGEGRSQAYIAYHWEHLDIPQAHRFWIKRSLRLGCRRAQRLRECAGRAGKEGLPPWEMGLVRDIGFYRQYLRERMRPCNYEKYGLVKRTDSIAPEAA